MDITLEGGRFVSVEFVSSIFSNSPFSSPAIGAAMDRACIDTGREFDAKVELLI